ncbi:MAG: cytidine deaminase [Rhodopirellula baltica]|uniref:Cytidine deaminase n=4 Tax=Rhodopirellula baltica TaxID=265606 RepID=Q7UJI0_RHOBA|nr:cytidine deaminase [Rhodopirellula baltica SH 1]
MAESAPHFGESTSLSLYPAMTDVHSHASEIDPPSDEDVQRLIQAAISARDHAYAPHSHFYVGAALLTHDGRIVEGCNVENASYSLTQCAERTAVCTAVAGGYRMFHAVAIASIGGAMPCGACRQVLAEFGSDLYVYTIDVIDGDQQMRRLSELLPDAFSTSDIPKR